SGVELTDAVMPDGTPVYYLSPILPFGYTLVQGHDPDTTYYIALGRTAVTERGWPVLGDHFGEPVLLQAPGRWKIKRVDGKGFLDGDITGFMWVRDAGARV